MLNRGGQAIHLNPVARSPTLILTLMKQTEMIYRIVFLQRSFVFPKKIARRLLHVFVRDKIFKMLCQSREEIAKIFVIIFFFRDTKRNKSGHDLQEFTVVNPDLMVIVKEQNKFLILIEKRRTQVFFALL